MRKLFILLFVIGFAMLLYMLIGLSFWKLYVADFSFALNITFNPFGLISIISSSFTTFVIAMDTLLFGGLIGIVVTTVINNAQNNDGGQASVPNTMMRDNKKTHSNNENIFDA